MTSAAQKNITLALQGGGSHGAFTWGVLDRLVEEPSLDIQAISGTSAGALNAAVLISGLKKSGAEGAKKALHDFWHSVSRAGDGVFNPLAHWNPVLASAYGGFVSHIWSPYDNPFYSNALAPLVDAGIDFELVRAAAKPKLFVCATNVRTNARKIFETAQLSADTLLASACLPGLFQAVEVGGEYYWDGGYMGNPALAPLLKFCEDLVIVGVNPLHRADIPRRAGDILDRLNEISFNASLVQEIETINILTKLIECGQLINSGYKPVRFHTIAAEEEMATLGQESKTDTSWDFLLKLYTWGRAKAGAWLEDSEQFGNVGVCSSINVETKFIEPSLHGGTARTAPGDSS